MHRSNKTRLLHFAVAFVGAGVLGSFANAAPGDIYNLGTLGSGYTSSAGQAINASAQVAGYSTTASNVSRAVRYSGTPGSGGAMADLGTLGGNTSEGHAINDAGQVAGYSQLTGSAARHAFRYTGTPGSGGAMVDLGTLGGAESYAFGINDAGFVVGHAQRSAGAGGGFAATLWQIDAANTAVDLDVWLDANNPTLGAFWTLGGSPADINNNGLISGTGTYNDGPGGLTDGTRAYILDASSLVPEPSGLALIAIGLALLRRRQRRQQLGNQCQQRGSQC